MARFYVQLAKGPAYDPARGRREQAEWDEHAAFMDAIVAEGLVLLGGPVGEGDGEDVVLLCEATDAAEIRTRFAADPWIDRVIAIERIEPWQLWLEPGDD